MSHIINNFQKKAFRLSSLLDFFLIWLAFYDSTSV